MSDAEAPTPFHDLDSFLALPRLSGLTLSPDGRRLAVTCASLDDKATAYLTAVWEIDPAGERPARRLVAPTKGLSQARFAPDGSLLFVAARAQDGDDDEPAALWALPERGEARRLASAPGGIGHIDVAADAGTLLAAIPLLPSSKDLADDERLVKARKDAKVAAVLHSAMPIRHWDHDLGPAQVNLFAADLDDPPGEVEPKHPGRDEAAVPWRRVTAAPGRALDEASWHLSRDGRRAVATWRVPHRDGFHQALAAIDVASGEVRLIVDDPQLDVWDATLSDDGEQVAVIVEHLPTPDSAPRIRAATIAFSGGPLTTVCPEWDRWPTALRILPDGALLASADEDGRGPLFRLDPASGEARRLTDGEAAFSDLCLAPGGEVVYALRTSYLAPPEPVRIDLRSGEVTALRGPAPAPELPGWLTEVRTTSADGRDLRAWLALPDQADAERAPLAVWIHGGPLSSWNQWSWRWCPWLLVAAGYAVLLPDPALSLGYGQQFVQAGWGEWGAAPFTDIMTLTDAAVARDDIDPDRTCAMGGSFGGYMANWVAGHTDRFDAIVTHASLWSLDQFCETTDLPFIWRMEMSREAQRRNSPDQAVADITTPMLVIHGDLDDRVPVGEALRLFANLAEHHAADDGTMPHRFLLFPDENHWVLKPQNAKVWYLQVLAFLAEHVLGEPARRPELLG